MKVRDLVEKVELKPAIEWLKTNNYDKVIRKILMELEPFATMIDTARWETSARGKEDPVARKIIDEMDEHIKKIGYGLQDLLPLLDKIKKHKPPKQ